MQNINLSNLKFVMYQFLITGTVCFVGFSIESYYRDILFLDGLINLTLVKLIFIRSFGFSLGATLIYQVTYSNLFAIYSNLFKSDQSDLKGKLIRVLSDLLITLSAILVFIPVRPIIQETFLESNISDIYYVFVKYDTVFSLIILIIVALPLIFLVWQKRLQERFKILLAIGVLLIVTGFLSSNSIISKIFESRANWVQKDWQEQEIKARQVLDEPNVSDQEKSVAFFWLGVAENRQGNHIEAIEYQLEALKLDPTNYAAHASIANGYLGSKNLDKAYEHIQLCIKFNPNYAWCYQALGNYYIVTQDIQLAISNFKKATDLDPKNRELLNTYQSYLKISKDPYLSKISKIENIYDSGDLKKYCKEIGDLFSLVLDNEKRSDAHRLLGTCFRDNGDLDKAIKELEKSVELNPLNKHSYIVLSGIYVEKQDLSKALEFAKKSILLDKKYAWGYNQLGYIYALQGEKEKGLEFVNKAIILDPLEIVFQKNLTWIKNSK